MADRPIVFFIHMPKSGGSTMGQILQSQYEINEVLSYHHTEDLSKKKALIDCDSIKVVQGHYFFGLHKYFHRPFSYFTILRDPIDRVVSLYYYLRSTEGKQYDIYRQMTLQQFVENKIEANIQTTYLAGEDGNGSLLKAVRNLTQMCDVVGTTEQFNETLYLLKQKYGWSDVFYERINVTKQRKKLEEISEETIEKIKSIHYKDVVLYRFAKKVMERQLSQLSEEERLEMVKFKRSQLNFEKA